MPIMPLTFDQGLNKFNDPLLLKDGELIEVEGFTYDNPGRLQVRNPLYIALTGDHVDIIHSLHRYVNWVLIGTRNSQNGRSYLEYYWDLSGYCDLYMIPSLHFISAAEMATAKRLIFADTDLFSFIVNGIDSKAFTKGNVYQWRIENPVNAPTGSAGSAGNPNDTYSLYYTYLVMFPNWIAHETGPSPAGSVTVASEAITWGGIAPCPYSGTGTIIHRKLYRYSATLGETYYVTTIQDNTTTTYTDDLTDATLQTNNALATTTYQPVPAQMTSICEHSGRLFGVKDNMLYWSEAYLPFAFPSANSIQVTIEGENLIGLISYGNQLFMASKKTWYRLQGDTPANYAVKGTFAEVGVLSQHLIKGTEYGIIHTWYDGTYLFDGALTRNITQARLGRQYFLGIKNLENATSEWMRNKYQLLYLDSYESDIDSYTKLFITGDDKQGSPPVDLTKRHILTRNGVYPYIDNNKYYLGDGSVYFEDGDLSASSSSDFDLDEEMTFSFHVLIPDTTRTDIYLFQYYQSATEYYACYWDGSKIYFKVVTGGATFYSHSATWAPSANTWYEVEIIKGWGSTANALTFVVRGTAIAVAFATVASWPTFATGTFYLGKYTTLRTGPVYIDHFMVSKGIARHTANYTVAQNIQHNELVADFSTYPSIRYYHTGRDVSALHFSPKANREYIGKLYLDGPTYGYLGMIYEEDDLIHSNSIDTPISLQTGDKAGGNILKMKCLEFLIYDADTKDQDLTLTVYADGVAQSPTITINTSARERKKIPIPVYQGYYFSFKLECDDAQMMTIYEPWAVGYTEFGDY